MHCNLGCLSRDRDDVTRDFGRAALTYPCWESASFLSKRQPLICLVADELITWAEFLCFGRKGSGARAISLPPTSWLCPPDFAHSAPLRDSLLHPNLREIIDSDKDISSLAHITTHAHSKRTAGCPGWFLRAMTNQLFTSRHKASHCRSYFFN